VKPLRICAVIVDKDIRAIKEAEPLADLFEVRIDLIGDGWRELARQLKKPWIACNRRLDEGGKWQQSEAKRIDELEKAVQLGADTIDIELRAKGLEQFIRQFKGKAKFLISFHELRGTPPLEEMKKLVRRQLALGADICKVVPTAQRLEDNLTVLQLIKEFPEVKIVAVAMGSLGLVSRVLCPLAGGYFTYASVTEGKESAPGQITVANLKRIYEMLPGV